MRNFDPRKFVFLILLLAPFASQLAQKPLVWGASPFQDSLWSIDTTNWTVVDRIGPNLPGFTITGITGMAWDPITHNTYVVMKVSGVAPRVLGTIDLKTGNCTTVGNLGPDATAKFATINFRADGQLFGVTGQGGSPPETMYLIDKHTAAKSLAISLGNGNDGEIISYNWDDGNFYHWSGNGTVVMEKFPATAPYTPVTNIVTTGLTGGETFGALYLGGGNFLMSNIASHFKYANAVGTYGNDLINLPDDLRGIVLPPNYEISDDTVCVNDIVTYGMVGIARDTAVYFWGDGSSSTVFPAGPASHSYTTAGNYTAYAVLKNDTVENDTMASTAMVVRALPAVALVPGTDTIMCFADTLDLIGASGGTLQWYMNGSAIVGANSASYQVTANGHYNMTKTNLNGCTDSAAVGVMVVFGNQPTADLGADSTVCEGDTICYALSNPADVSYLWSDGNTSASDCFIASAAGTTAISVRATDSAGCIASDTTNITVIGFPNPSVSVDTSNCPTIVFTVSDPNGAAWVWNFGDGSPTASGMTVSHTYLVNNSYSPQVTASNQCFSVVDSGALLIQCIVGVDNALAHAIHIAPNPSNGQFVLQAALPAATSFSYRITDLQGREHLAKSYDDARSNWSEKIDFHGASGIYFLNVTAGDQRIAYRLVIQ